MYWKFHISIYFTLSACCMCCMCPVVEWTTHLCMVTRLEREEMRAAFAQLQHLDLTDRVELPCHYIKGDRYYSCVHHSCVRDRRGSLRKVAIEVRRPSKDVDVNNVMRDSYSTRVRPSETCLSTRCSFANSQFGILSSTPILQYCLGMHISTLVHTQCSFRIGWTMARSWPFSTRTLE